MFLNYGVLLGNSLMTLKCNLGNRTNLSFFYAFHHPIYHYINFFDLINVFSSPQEVKMLFRKNMIFTSSLLERNHEGGEFMLESERNKETKLVHHIS